MPTTTSIALDTWANFETINLRVVPTVDTWETSTIAVTGRVQFGGNWHDIHDLVLDPTGNIYWGKIFGLEEGTAYPIEITWTRTATDDGEVLETVITTTTTTTRSSPVSPDSSFVYMSPTGNDLTGTGGYAHPYKTPVESVSALGTGGTLIMKNGIYGPAVANGTYTFSEATWGVTSRSGTALAYKTIRAETPGQVVISGAQRINGLSWTKHATRIYWADYSSFMKTTVTKEAPRFVRRVSSGNILYLYGGLDSSSGSNIGINTGTLTLEGFAIDWTNNRIYIRLASTDSDSAPVDDMYEASYRQNGLRFSSCDFWIVDGLKEEMFGWIIPGASQYLSAQTAAYTHRIYNCDDHVTRNCTFTACLARFEAGGVRNTLEDSTVTVNDPLGKLLANPWSATLHGYGHSSANAFNAVHCDDVGDQLVIRRNTIEKADACIVANSSDTATFRFVDIYENTFNWCGDDSIEIDTSGADGSGINCAVFHNTFYYVNNMISLSPFNPGPVWFFGNIGQECGLFYHFKIGQALVSDGSVNSIGHKLIYNNTIYTSVGADDGNCFHFNGGAGNVQLINNILRGSGDRYISDGGTNDYQQPNIIKTNAFYLPVPHASPFMHLANGYATEALYAAAALAADGFIVSGNLVGSDPFPNGFGGTLLPALATMGTRIKGITTIAGDANGVPLGATRTGRFETFAYPEANAASPPPTDTGARLRVEVTVSGSLRIE